MQPLRIEDLIESAYAARPASRLLSGLGAKISIASDLPSRARPRESLATGVVPLDCLLAGGLPKGELIELAGCRSSGRFSIGLAALASVTSTGEPATLVDLGEHLDPQAAAQAGVDLDLLLWVRPRRVKEALASVEMLLAAGFPLVVADLGLSPRGGRYVPDAAWLRVARAAQAQNSSVLLLTPYRMSGIAADAVLTAGSSRPRWQGAGKTPRLLTTLDSRLTLQKLARTTPGTTAPLSLPLLPLPAENSLSPRERAGVRGIGRVNPKSKIQNPKPQIHPASLEIRNPRPARKSEIRNPKSEISSITNHKSPITNSS
jgi:hypothetical protein